MEPMTVFKMRSVCTGPADKGVGGAAHLHDGDLLPPVEGGQFDGVGDNKQAHRQQDHHQDHGHRPGDVADDGEASAISGADFSLGHAGYLFLPRFSVSVSLLMSSR